MTTEDPTNSEQVEAVILRFPMPGDEYLDRVVQLRDAVARGVTALMALESGASTGISELATEALGDIAELMDGKLEEPA
jgi:hypothetical protein